MARAAWVAAFAVALAAVGFVVAGNDGTFTASGEEAEDPVLAHPQDGDRARYMVVTDDDADRPDRFRSTWSLEQARLPDGSRAALPSLGHEPLDLPRTTSYGDTGSDAERALPAPPSVATIDALAEPPTRPGDEPASSTAERTVLEQRYTRHATEIPGTPVAYSHHAQTEQVTKRNGETREQTTTLDTTNLVDERGPCWGSTAMRLTGLSADDAHEHLESCIQDRLDERDLDEELEATVGVESRWSANETWERVWIAHVNTTVTGPDVDLDRSRTLVTSPSVSLPLVDVSQTAGTSDGEAVDRRSGTRLVAYETGAEPIEDAEPLAEMPTLERVGWDVDGPAQGDLEAAPFEKAYDAVGRTDEGRAFFQAAEDPRVVSAQLTDADRAPDTSGSMRSANGDTCESDLATELPEEAGQRTWHIFWSSESEGRLWGITQEPRALRDHGIDEVQPPTPWARAFHSDEGETWPPFGHVPPLEGPSLVDLWDKRDLVDPFQDQGTDKLTLTSWTLDEPDALSGSIGRVDCTAGATDDAWRLEETMIRFEDDVGTSVWTFVISGDW